MTDQVSNIGVRLTLEDNFTAPLKEATSALGTFQQQAKRASSGAGQMKAGGAAGGAYTAAGPNAAQNLSGVNVSLTVNQANLNALRAQIIRGLGTIPITVSAKMVQGQAKAVMAGMITETVGTRSGAAHEVESTVKRNLPQRAAGGPVESRRPVIVGERRPEVFVPHTAGRIEHDLAAYRRREAELASLEYQIQRRRARLERERMLDLEEAKLAGSTNIHGTVGEGPWHYRRGGRVRGYGGKFGARPGSVRGWHDYQNMLWGESIGDPGWAFHATDMLPEIRGAYRSTYGTGIYPNSPVYGGGRGSFWSDIPLTAYRDASLLRTRLGSGFTGAFGGWHGQPNNEYYTTDRTVPRSALQYWGDDNYWHRFRRGRARARGGITSRYPFANIDNIIQREARLARDFAGPPASAIPPAWLFQQIGPQGKAGMIWNNMMRGPEGLYQVPKAMRAYASQFIPPSSDTAMLPPIPAIPWTQSRRTSEEVARMMTLGRFMPRRPRPMGAGSRTVWSSDEPPGTMTFEVNGVNTPFYGTQAEIMEEIRLLASQGAEIRPPRRVFEAIGPTDIHSSARSFIRRPRRMGGGLVHARKGIFRAVPPDDFFAAINAASQVVRPGGRRVGETVHVYSPEEYAAMRTYLAKDRLTGYAIKDEGELVSVFNVGQRGMGKSAVRSAIQRGAMTLDAFDEFGTYLQMPAGNLKRFMEKRNLPGFYSKFGFREIGREPWNPEYAPEGWAGGTPDIVYMARRIQKLMKRGYGGLAHAQGGLANAVSEYRRFSDLAAANPLSRFGGNIWYPGRRRAMLEEAKQRGWLDRSSFATFRRSAENILAVPGLASPGVSDAIAVKWSHAILDAIAASGPAGRGQEEAFVRALQARTPGLGVGYGYGNFAKAAAVASGHIWPPPFGISPKVEPFYHALRGREHELVADVHHLMAGNYDPNGPASKVLEIVRQKQVVGYKPTALREEMLAASAQVQAEYAELWPTMRRWQAAIWGEHFPFGGKPQPIEAAYQNLIVPKGWRRRLPPGWKLGPRGLLEPRALGGVVHPMQGFLSSVFQTASDWAKDPFMAMMAYQSMAGDKQQGRKRGGPVDWRAPLRRGDVPRNLKAAALDAYEHYSTRALQLGPGASDRTMLDMFTAATNLGIDPQELLTWAKTRFSVLSNLELKESHPVGQSIEGMLEKVLPRVMKEPGFATRAMMNRRAVFPRYDKPEWAFNNPLDLASNAARVYGWPATPEHFLGSPLEQSFRPSRYVEEFWKSFQPELTLGKSHQPGMIGDPGEFDLTGRSMSKRQLLANLLGATGSPYKVVDPTDIVTPSGPRMTLEHWGWSKNATGGPAPLKGLYIVGEIGPELFVPKRLSHLIPKKVMDQIPKAADGMQVIGKKRNELFAPPEDGIIVPNRLMDQIPHRQEGGPGEGGFWAPEEIPETADEVRHRRRSEAASRAADTRRRDREEADRLASVAARRTAPSRPSGLYPALTEVDAIERADRMALAAATAKKARSQRGLYAIERENIGAEMSVMRAGAGKVMPSRTIQGAIASVSSFLFGGVQQMTRAERERVLAQNAYTQSFKYTNRVTAEARAQYHALNEQVAKGEITWSDLKDQMKAIVPQVRAAKIAEKERLNALDEATRKAMPTVGGVVKNLGVIIGATSAYGIAMQAANAVIQPAVDGTIKAILKQADAWTGWRSTFTAVTTELAKQTVQAHGNVEAVMAQSAVTAGLSGSMLDYVKSATQASIVAKAGAMAQEETAQMQRAALGASRVPSGLIGGYGGVLGTSFLASELGGGKGFMETVAGQFAGNRNTQGGPDVIGALEQGLRFVGNTDYRNLILGFAKEQGSPIGNAGETLGDFGQYLRKNPITDLIGSPLFGLFNPLAGLANAMGGPAGMPVSGRSRGGPIGAAGERYAAMSGMSPEQIKADRQSMQDLNAAAERGADVLGNTTKVTWEYAASKEEEDKFVQQAILAGDEYGAMMARTSHIVIKTNGELANASNILAAEQQTATGKTMASAEAWAGLQLRQIRAQFQMAAAQGQRQRELQIPYGIYQQTLQQPLLPPGLGVIPGAGAGAGNIGGTGASRGVQTLVSSWVDQQRSAQEQINTIAATGLAKMRDDIRGSLGAGALADFDKWNVAAQNASTAIAEIQKKVGDLQAAASSLEWSNSIRIAKRSLGDALGMAGLGGAKTSAGAVMATNLGKMERASHFLEVSATRLSLALQERQITTQRALAGFQAPGETGEERYMRQKQALAEAAIAERKLTISEKEFGLSQKIWIENANRAAEDARKAIEVMQASRNASVATAEAEQAIAAEAKVMAANMSNMDTLVQQAQSNWQTVTSAALSGISQFAGGLDTGVKAIYKALGYTMSVGRQGQTIFTAGTGPSSGMPTVVLPSIGAPGRGNTKNTRGADRGVTNAAGFLGDVNVPTQMIVGEAGPETVAILRNPRMASLGGGGGGSSPTNVNININGPVVRGEQDISALAQAVAAEVERTLSRKGQMLGLRAPAY